jgi:hypothetical protein
MQKNTEIEKNSDNKNDVIDINKNGIIVDVNLKLCYSTYPCKHSVTKQLGDEKITYLICAKSLFKMLKNNDPKIQLTVNSR